MGAVPGTVLQELLNRFQNELASKEDPIRLGKLYHKTLGYAFDPKNDLPLEYRLLTVRHIPSILELYGKERLELFLKPEVISINTLSWMLQKMSLGDFNPSNGAILSATLPEDLKGLIILISFGFNELGWIGKTKNRYQLLKELDNISSPRKSRKKLISQLLIADYDLCMAFLYNLPLFDSSSEKNENALLQRYLAVIQKIYDQQPEYFDEDLINNLVIRFETCYFEEPISTVNIESMFNLLLLFEKHSYSINELVLCSKIESLILDIIGNDESRLYSYIETFELKDRNWMENSILSVESLMFTDIDSVTFSSYSEEIDWAVLLKYFQFYIDVLRLNPPSLQHMRPVIDVVLKTTKIIDIPRIYELEFKSKVCQFTNLIFELQLFPFDRKRHFDIILSYILFTLDDSLKKMAQSCLDSMINSDQQYYNENFGISNGSELITVFEDSKKNKSAAIDHCLRHFQKIPFFEFFSQIFNFKDLKETEQLARISRSFPKKIKQQVMKQIDELHFREELWPYGNFQDFLRCFVKPTHENISKARSACLQYLSLPSSFNITEKDARVFLFLYCGFKDGLTNKIKPQLSIDETVVFKMLDFEEPGIIEYLKLFFANNMKKVFFQNLIACLAKPNIPLLKIVKDLPALCQKIKGSKAKFEIFHSFYSNSVKGSEVTIPFFLSLLDIVDAETGTFANSSIWLKLVIDNYRLINVNDRLEFWDVFTNISNSFDSYNVLQSIFTELSKDNRNIYIDNKISFVYDPKQYTDLSLLDRVTLELKKARKINTAFPSEKRIDDGAVIKKFDGSSENKEVMITVYTKGRPADVDNEYFNSEKDRTLTSKERKDLFINNNSKKEKIQKYSEYITKLIVNDLFRCTFKNKFNVGKFIGQGFNSSINFSSCSTHKMHSVLQKYSPKHENICFYLLYSKYTDFLENRDMKSSASSQASKKD